MATSELVGAAFLVIGALLVLAEIHTLTLYLLAIAIGLFAAGGLALSGASLTADLALLAVVVALALPVAHWWRRKLKNLAADQLMHDDVGGLVTIESFINDGLRVDYRGTTWNARFDAGVSTLPQPGTPCIIVRREGNMLIIAPQAVH
jgi:membrane protein implicated in regulation of membrane protease activity